MYFIALLIHFFYLLLFFQRELEQEKPSKMAINFGTMISLSVFGVCIIIGISLLASGSSKDSSERREHNEKWIETSASILNFTENPRTCYVETDCDKCQSGEGLIRCENSIINGEYCAGTSRCCKYSYRRVYDPLTEKYKNEKYCSQKYNTNRCRSKVGICYNPTFDIRFYDFVSFNDIYTDISSECNYPDDIKCLNDFKKNRRVGGSEIVYYHRDTPETAYFTRPKYETSGSIIAMYDFGSIFIVSAFGAVCFAVYLTLN